VPLLFGWARLAAQRAGYVGLELGTALFAVGSIVTLGALVWIDARAIDAADREREKSEGLFRSFFNLGLVGMAQADARTGKFLKVNSKLPEITGYSNAELANLTIADITHPDDRAGDARALSDMFAGKTSLYSAEKRYVRHDGRQVCALVNTAAVHDAWTGQVTTVGVIQDITAFKETNDQLEQALRLREDFLSIAIHELRTPLTAILMQLQSVGRALARDASNAAYEPRIAKAIAGVRRLEKLIDELLDVSRITEGRMSLEPQRFDLAELVEEIAGRFSENAERQGTSITLDAKSVVGAWDRLRIDQVVTNLLSNALKYGGGSPVHVTVACDATHAVICVRDGGIGISGSAGAHLRTFRTERGIALVRRVRVGPVDRPRDRAAERRHDLGRERRGRRRVLHRAAAAPVTASESQKSHFCIFKPVTAAMGVASPRLGSTVASYLAHAGAPAPLGSPLLAKRDQ
jgi:PAS domain S-box-containing protein